MILNIDHVCTLTSLNKGNLLLSNAALLTFREWHDDRSINKTG